MQAPIESLFPNGGNTLESLAEAIVFLADFFRQAIAKFLEEFSDVGMFLGPIGGIDAQQFVHRFAGHVDAVERNRVRSGNRANGSFRRGGLSFDPFEHPLQDARIFAITRPKEFSVSTLAEPIHMENLRRM